MQPWPEPETAPLTAEDRAIIVRQGTPPSVVAQRIQTDAYHSEWLADCIDWHKPGVRESVVVEGIAANIHRVIDHGDPDNTWAVY